MPKRIFIVGGGIIGLSTAWRLLHTTPDAQITILEKEQALATHQTGRNSGVIHSGIYYRPGTQKALTCRAGHRQLIEFCDTHDIPYELCGKVIVATQDDQQHQLDILMDRGTKNGVSCRPISLPALREREPHVAGVGAIEVDDTGIVDYPALCQKLASLLTDQGVRIRVGCEVSAIDSETSPLRVNASGDIVEADFLVNCAGLHSDRIATRCGLDPGLQILPFKGEYYELTPEAIGLCKHLIYPVPNPSFPFLGVHLTRMIDGRVECGPNAVLALGREAYGTFSANGADLWESLRYPGFQKLAATYWKTGLGEWHRSLSKSAFTQALQKLVPDLRKEMLVPAEPGIRAQAVRADGQLVDDFAFLDGPKSLHVCNAPSPAATASLEIGRIIAERVNAQL